MIREIPKCDISDTSLLNKNKTEQNIVICLKNPIVLKILFRLVEFFELFEPNRIQNTKLIRELHCNGIAIERVE